ncbi:MAG: HlyD family efflux transporter periplasmic adaptor subunit [Pseudomonadota bacterium]|nr:HlyD family efflux transporter periplasmic adaptor subunit [Pseudomonadota bacterium]
MTTTLFRPEAIAHQQEVKMGDAFHAHTSMLIWLSGLMVLLAIAVAVFLVWGEYTRKARVAGFLAPSSGMIKVFTPQSATVIERRAKEGQAVERGDVLFVLSSEQASLENDDAQAAAIESIVARRASLFEELEQQDELNRVQWQDMQRQVQNLDAELSQLDQAIAVQQQRVQVATQTLNKFRQLYANHYVSEVQWQEKQELTLAQQALLQNLKRDRATLDRERGVLQANIDSSRYQFARQRAELDRLISTTEQQLTEYRAKRSIVIRAPAAGTVTAVLLQEGQVANRQAPLLSILPKDSQLQVNLLVPSRAIGFIEQGQAVALRYQAFPYQRFGLQPGTVKEVSRTLIKPGEADFPVALAEPAYRVIVQPEQQSFHAYARDIPLQAGMLLDADIELDKYSLIEWVFDPLYSLAGAL